MDNIPNHFNRFMHLLLNYISGAYVPLTVEGSIIVDDVLASCYASVDHDIAHFAMAPMKRFPGLVDLFVAENNDSPVFVDIVKELTKLFLPSEYKIV